MARISGRPGAVSGVIVPLFADPGRRARRGWITAAWLLLCISDNPLANGAESDVCIDRASKEVLVVFFDQVSRPYSRELLTGIDAGLEGCTSISVFYEFMGPTALDGAEVTRRRDALLAERYSHRSIDLVVAIGDPALHAGLKIRKQHFPSAKLIFLVAFQDSVPADLPGDEGLVIDINPAVTTKLVLGMLPGITKLFVVGGTSPFDRTLRDNFLKLLKMSHPKIEVVQLIGLPIEDLRRAARSIPPRSLVVLTTNFSDRQARPTPNPEIVRAISSATAAPIVEGTDLSFGQGSLGGDVASLRLTGLELGRMIRSSLGSEKARADLIVRPAPRRLAYDWRQLQRLNISAALTPAAAEILYRPPSVWQEHRETILIGASALVLQTILIWILLAERRRRARVQAGLSRRLKLEELVSRAESSIVSAAQGELPECLDQVLESLASTSIQNGSHCGGTPARLDTR